MSKINYILIIKDNKLEITFYTTEVEVLEDNEESIGQTYLIIKDRYINVIKMIDNVLGKKHNINEITITFNELKNIDFNNTLSFDGNSVSNINVDIISNIIILKSPFYNYSFNLKTVNFLLDILINPNYCTFKGNVNTLGIIISNIVDGGAFANDDGEDINFNILAFDFKDLIFNKQNNALRIDYEKSLFSDKLLSILTDETNYNISKYTSSQITRGYMHFYYFKVTKKLYLQYHESRGMTISCVYYNKNNTQEILDGSLVKIVKVANNSTIQDNTSGGIYNQSINYATSLFGDQKINFTDRNIIMSVSFDNSYFYGASCEIKEDKNNLIYTCNVCDYTRINDNFEDESEYVYYNIGVYSKKQQIKKSDYLNLDWELIENEYLDNIIVNKIYNNKMTIYANGVYIFGDEDNDNEEFDNIMCNTSIIKDKLLNDINDINKDNSGNEVVAYAIKDVGNENDNTENINKNVMSVYEYPVSKEGDKKIYNINSKFTDVSDLDFSTIWLKYNASFFEPNNSMKTDQKTMANLLSKNNAIVIDQNTTSDVNIFANGLLAGTNTAIGNSNTSHVSDVVQMYSQSVTDSLENASLESVKEVLSNTYVAAKVDKESIKLSAGNKNKKKTKTRKNQYKVDMILRIKRNRKKNTEQSGNPKLAVKGASSLITNENPIQTLIFAGTKIEEDIKTTTYGTLNVFINTIEPSKLKLIEKEESEYDENKSPITFENIRITTLEDQCLEIVLPNTVIEKPEIKQIELFDGKIKFSGSTVSQLSVNSIVLYKDVNPSDVIFGINLKNIKIIKVDNTKKQKLIKRYQTLILMSTLVNKNTDEYKLMLLEILKLKKKIAITV